MVEAADGSWWMVLLGVRPRGMTPAFHVLGRETFLTPVRWRDGWPEPAALSLDMHHPAPGSEEKLPPPGRDDFDRPALAPLWVGVRRSPAMTSSLGERPGWLVMTGTEATLDSPEPVFVGRRQQHHHCRASTCLDPGSAAEAGLTVYVDGFAHYEVGIRGDRVIARVRIGPIESIVGDARAPDGPVVLTIDTGPHAHGPDTVSLGFVDDGGSERVLAQVDGRYVSTEVNGGFLGRILGMYAVGGVAAFDWFDYGER